MNADLREVWKRLALEGRVIHTYGTDGNLDNPIWAQSITQDYAFLGFWWPSAMQGCKL